MIMEVLGLIPARGGSKSIPMKNMKKLCGKPLIYYSINSAIHSKLISKVIVSTDNPQIKSFSKKTGAEVPFLRPKKISQGKSSTLDVIIHALTYLSNHESYIPDIVTLLQPTTPFRTTEMIDLSIRMLQRSNADIVLGVKISKNHPFRSFWHKKFLKPLKKDFLKYHQRQLFPTNYYPTGEIYTFWTKNLTKFNHIYGPKIVPLISKKNQISIDIDNPVDFFIAEQIMSNWRKLSKLS